MLRARTTQPAEVTQERPEAEATPADGGLILSVRTHLRAGAVVATDTTALPTTGDSSCTA